MPGALVSLIVKKLKKAIDLLAKDTFRSMDFFCAIRYYKGMRKTDPL